MSQPVRLALLAWDMVLVLGSALIILGLLQTPPPLTPAHLGLGLLALANLIAVAMPGA